jgi:hypothetical protein
MNGCWNRDSLKDKHIVQHGWIYEGTTRIPIMAYIEDPMTKTCQYQKLKKDDIKCVGCRELEEV